MNRNINQYNRNKSSTTLNLRLYETQFVSQRDGAWYSVHASKFNKARIARE